MVAEVRWRAGLKFRNYVDVFYERSRRMCQCGKMSGKWARRRFSRAGYKFWRLKLPSKCSVEDFCGTSVAYQCSRFWLSQERCLVIWYAPIWVSCPISAVPNALINLAPNWAGIITPLLVSRVVVLASGHLALPPRRERSGCFVCRKECLLHSWK